MESTPPSDDSLNLDLIPLDLEDDVLKELFELPYIISLLDEETNSQFINTISSKRPLEEPSTSGLPNKARKIEHPYLNPVAQSNLDPVAHCSKNPPQTINFDTPRRPITEEDLELLAQERRTGNDDEIPPDSELSGRGERPAAFTIISENVRRVKKFDSVASLLTLQFRDVLPDENIHEYLRDIFGALLDHFARDGIHAWDRVGLTIRSDRPEQRPIGISIRRWDQLTPDVILQTIEAVMQSNEEFFINGRLQVSAI